MSQLNRAAASSAVVVEPELFDFIARSLDYSRESGGAFDITVGPLMKAWGFFKGDGRVPHRRRVERGAGAASAIATSSSIDRRAQFDSMSPASSSISAGSPKATPSIASSLSCSDTASPRRSSAPAAARCTDSAIRPTGARGTSRSRIRSTREGRVQRRPDEPRAVDGRALGEVVRGERRPLLAHHGSAHRTAGAGHLERGGHVSDRHRRRCAGRCAVRDGRERRPANT